jgi:hypothetical protein
MSINSFLVGAVDDPLSYFYLTANIASGSLLNGSRNFGSNARLILTAGVVQIPVLNERGRVTMENSQAAGIHVLNYDQGIALASMVSPDWRTQRGHGEYLWQQAQQSLSIASR